MPADGVVPVSGTERGHDTRPGEPCRHDSRRIDGTLDCHCLRCGADGYWHDGHRHDRNHPSGKILFILGCEEVPDVSR